MTRRVVCNFSQKSAQEPRKICGGKRNKSSAVAEMGDRFATIDMGRKLEAVPLWGWGAGYLWGSWSRPTAYQMAFDPSSRLAT